MNQVDLSKAINEAHRFLEKAEELVKCTNSSKVSGKDSSHYKVYKFDHGLNSGCAPSKRRAAVKRSAIDLRNELSKLNKVDR